ncbi:hypothetical protein [Arthrobacter sp. 135MFCol5.1]|uniref:hypothetical protein n=1 Tax=Arthrobacter sp. 135MFCol5.1 TaxID=1158050 RepID=UPI0003603A89|nr:hypothetical protein [Arthrobacter sp. 135MFCol5.1]
MSTGQIQPRIALIGDAPATWSRNKLQALEFADTDIWNPLFGHRHGNTPAS